MSEIRGVDTKHIVKPNDDWRDRSKISIYIPAGSEYNKDELAEFVGNGLAQLFASVSLPMYQRHRLAGNREAIGIFAMMEAIHGLTSACFPIFAAMNRVGRRPAGHGGAAGGADRRYDPGR